MAHIYGYYDGEYPKEQVVFKILCIPFVSIEPHEGYMVRRFAAPIKKQYPDS